MPAATEPACALAFSRASPVTLNQDVNKLSKRCTGEHKTKRVIQMVTDFWS